MKKYLKFSPIIIFLFQLFDFDFGECEIVMEKVESINGSKIDGYIIFNELKIVKYNRSAYALNIDFELLVDIDNNFEVSITLKKSGNLYV